MLIKVAEAAVNRISPAEASKAVAKLQRQGSLDAAVGAVTAAAKYAQNYMANANGEVRDNALNASEKKIITKALLRQIVQQMGYAPEDL